MGPAVMMKLVDLEAIIKRRVGNCDGDEVIDPELLDYLPRPPKDMFDEEDTVVAHEGEQGRADDDERTTESYVEYWSAQVLPSQEAKRPRRSNG
jgi:hypothetical protein